MFPVVGTGAENIALVALREIQLPLLALALHSDKSAAGGRLAHRLWLGAGGKELIERHDLRFLLSIHGVSSRGSFSRQEIPFTPLSLQREARKIVLVISKAFVVGCSAWMTLPR